MTPASRGGCGRASSLEVANAVCWPEMSEPQLGQKRAPACIGCPQRGQLVVWVVTEAVNISVARLFGTRCGAEGVHAWGMKLLARVRQALRLRHYSRRTEQVYGGQVSASTQNQALGALLFLYRKVRVRAVFERLRGKELLVAGLLYGSGLRLFEALELRVKDIDFERGEIVIRRGKGAKDRVTILADGQKLALRRHLERTRLEHEREGVSGWSCALGHEDWRTSAASPASDGCAAGLSRGGAHEWRRQARILPHIAPLVRDALAGDGL